MATLWNHVANLNQADKQEAADRDAAQRIVKKNEAEAAAEAAAACNLRINDKVIYTSADGRNSFEATIVHIGVLTDNDYTITFLGEAGVLKDKSTVRERLRLGGSGGVTATEQASTSTSSSTSTCCVCMAEENTHAFTPCGHKCVCSGCAGVLMSSTCKCPLCNSPSTSTIRIFIP